ncbi:MAG: DUF1634 domain-containing protein [Gemmatimonadota bacterium]
MNPATDEKLELEIARWLQVGVMLAAGVVLVGGVAYLALYGGTPVSLQTFRGEPAQLRSLGGIAAGVAELDSRAIIQFGVVLLISTPIVRVALTLVAFIRQGDRLYVWITALVLGLLLFSLLHGRV